MPRIPERFWQCLHPDYWIFLIVLTAPDSCKIWLHLRPWHLEVLTMPTAWLLGGFWQCLLPLIPGGFDSAHCLIAGRFLTVFTAPYSWRFCQCRPPDHWEVFWQCLLPDYCKILAELTPMILGGSWQCLLPDCWEILTVLTAWLLGVFWRCLQPDYWEVLTVLTAWLLGGFDSAYCLITGRFCQCLLPDYCEVLTVLTAWLLWGFDSAYCLITVRFNCLWFLEGFDSAYYPWYCKILTVLTAWLLGGIWHCFLPLILARFWQCLLPDYWKAFDSAYCPWFFFFFNYLLSPKGRTCIFHRKTS